MQSNFQGNVTYNPNAVSGMHNCSLRAEVECLGDILENGFGMVGSGNTSNTTSYGNTTSACQVIHVLIKKIYFPEFEKFNCIYFFICITIIYFDIEFLYLTFYHIL